MSSIEPYFFNNLSLKYLATVKTVHVLWTQLKSGEDFKKSFSNFFQTDDVTNRSITTLRNLITQKFDSFVEKLMLPKTIENDLSLFFWQMYKPVFEWLKMAVRRRITIDEVNSISRFMDSIIWDDIGYIDERKRLESRLSDRATIDYETWVKLCNYCSEDYLRKYSELVNWRGSRFNSNITIFWYYTIYGTFPMESMFNSYLDFINFEIERESGIYEENNINGILFRNSVSRNNLSAVKYFWKRLTDVQKLELSSEDNNFFITQCDAIAVYLLTQMKFKYSSKYPMDCGPWKGLLGWPWVLFIDSWIDQCKNWDKYQFVAFFTTLVAQRRVEQEVVGIEEMTMRQSRGHLNAKYYTPCEKLWAICNEKFEPMDETVLSIAAAMFYSEDIVLCKIVMEGSTRTWRNICLKNVGNFNRIFSGYIKNQHFYDIFMKEILEDDEERTICQGILNKASGD